MGTSTDLEVTTDYLARQKEGNWPDVDVAEKAFAYALLHNSYNVAKAATEANITLLKAKKLLRSPLVTAFIGALQETRHVTNIVTDDFVRSQYLKILPKLMGEESIPIVLGNGVSIEEKKFHSGEVVSVLKELGKATDFYKDGDTQSAGVQVVINVGDLLGNVQPIKVLDTEGHVIEDRNPE